MWYKIVILILFMLNVALVIADNYEMKKDIQDFKYSSMYIGTAPTVLNRR